MHALDPILPVCSRLEGAGPRHNTRALVPMWAVLQLMTMVIVVNGCMMYLHFLPLFVSQGLVVAADMKQAKANATVYKTYRCIQIMVTHFNHCISFVAPAHILYLDIIC